MFQDQLQNRAHNGDETAFRELYSRYSREIYAIAHTALGSSDKARAVVKQVFYHIYRELMRAEADLDLPARLSSLTNEEIRIARIIAGDLSPEALQGAFFVTASAPVSANTMQRVYAHMQQQSTATPVAEDPSPLPTVEPEVPAVEPVEEPVPTDEVAKTEPDDEVLPDLLTESAEEPMPELSETPALDSSVDPFEEPQTAVEPDAEESSAGTDIVSTKKSSRKGILTAEILLTILLIVFLWLLCGILMDLKILPFYDLGYTLFNQHVFEFFRLP